MYEYRISAVASLYITVQAENDAEALETAKTIFEELPEELPARHWCHDLEPECGLQAVFYVDPDMSKLGIEDAPING